MNHSKTFEDPQTGACTNTIEGLWRIAKHRIPHYRRENKKFTGYLAKFMFLNKTRRQGLDPVKEFCKQAGLLYKNIQFSLADIFDNRNNNEMDDTDEFE